MTYLQYKDITKRTKDIFHAFWQLATPDLVTLFSQDQKDSVIVVPWCGQDALLSNGKWGLVEVLDTGHCFIQDWIIGLACARGIETERYLEYVPLMDQILHSYGLPKNVEASILLTRGNARLAPRDFKGFFNCRTNTQTRISYCTEKHECTLEEIYELQKVRYSRFVKAPAT